jgi:hypothetical protein
MKSSIDLGRKGEGSFVECERERERERAHHPLWCMRAVEVMGSIRRSRLIGGFKEKVAPAV